MNHEVIIILETALTNMIVASQKLATPKWSVAAVSGSVVVLLIKTLPVLDVSHASMSARSDVLEPSVGQSLLRRNPLRWVKIR